MEKVEDLYDALEEGNEEHVKVLLKKNRKMNVSFQFKDKVFFISKLFFLSSFSFLNFVFIFVQYGMTTLHKAAEKGFEESVKLLIEHGSKVDLQDQVLIFFFF